MRTTNSIKFSTRLLILMESQRINRRRRRNLPAELMVEIVDCLPLENAAHFLANVPNRLIIHHCAPRVRRILKMIDQIVIGYARTLSAASSGGYINLYNGYQYTPEIDIFLRCGAAHCRGFGIWHGTSDRGFVGYPAEFFDDLIEYYYETKAPAKIVHVIIELPLENPAPWPAALVQTRAVEMDVEELEVNNVRKRVRYILCNKNKPGIAFKLGIYFEGDAKCYQQMTRFIMWREKDVQIVCPRYGGGMSIGELKLERRPKKMEVEEGIGGKQGNEQWTRVNI